MSLHFCKKCGTLYDDKNGDCPKCATQPILDRIVNNAAEEINPEMPPEEARKKRIKDWIQIIIGVPMLIGFIYLIFYLMKLIKG